MTPKKPAPKPSPTILLVDDEPDFLAGVREVLEAAGYSVITAPDLRSGREALKTKNLALAILDVNLPDGEGYELMNELRRSGSTLPVLFLTVRNEMKDILKGIAEGGRDYLTKPFGKAELLAAIHRVLAA